MCGICGFVGAADEDLAQSMAKTMAHRGPDGEGVRSFPSQNDLPPATLAHRRLSIIDPSPRGAQPMADSQKRYWITYNGELYNFKSLRDELRQGGYNFISDCDTEVVIAMYAKYGAAMLERLNGIFAFAIWDSLDGKLFFARDRLGVKPLYYQQQKDTFCFASEVKALQCVCGSTGLREDVLSEYLTFLWVPDPDTLFNDVYQLLPGHYATYKSGRLTIQQYWDMSFEPSEARETEWANQVRETVSAAVQRQMVSDVPLGSFLSGGLDSSAIVAEMAASRERVSTYTVGFNSNDLAHEILPDDVRYARKMAEEFKLNYHERILDADIVDLLPKLIWQMDEPVADPAAINTYLICAAAKEELTVILSGMGGDEIFAGYPRHLAARLGRFVDWIPAGLRTAAGQSLDRHLTLGQPGRLRGPRRNLLKLARGIGGDHRERYLAYSSYYRRSELAALLSEEMRAQYGEQNPFRKHHAYFDTVADQHWLNQLLYVDLKTFLPCLNLTYTDKMSMATSTEVRVPLLDDELVSLSGRIPANLKLRGLKRKYIFKRSMEPVLPKEIIWRPKAGFSAPLRSWLVNELKPMVDETLSPENIRNRGLFNPTAVKQLLKDNQEGRADNALRIWALVTLELWQQTFTDNTKLSANRLN